MTVFRVLFADDSVARVLEQGLDGVTDGDRRWQMMLDKIHRSDSSSAIHVAATLLAAAQKLERKTPVHFYVARDLRFESGSSIVFRWPKEAPEFDLDLPLHGLILDLKGITLRRSLKLAPGDVDGASGAELLELNDEFPGAAFFLKRVEALKSSNCRVFILTAYVREEGAIRKFLYERHCWPQGDGTLDVDVMLFSSSTPEQIETLASTLVSKYRAFDRGFTYQRQLGDVEFAAWHDQPVLIVGESGTSKESIAQEIHDQWRTRRRSDSLEIAVVNCGGLSAELAQSELFGHVKGSFTGADDHRLGRILGLCGCELARPARLADVEAASVTKLRAAATALATLQELLERLQFEDAKRLFNGPLGQALVECFSEGYLRQLTTEVRGWDARLRRATSAGNQIEAFRDALLGNTVLELDPEHPNGLDLRFVDRSGPRGTLFLDEFGDLPPHIQILILRFLSQGGEVQPHGYPGVIRGAVVRVICATSDPRVAAFAGEKLLGSWRTRTELESPLRLDLLFRVKGQVIRSTPITKENARQVVDHFVQVEREAGGPVWEAGASEYLTREIVALLEQIRRAEGVEGGGGLDERPAFGHFREIQRVLRLAAELQKTARLRGLHAPEKVTEQIVRLVWRVSRLDSGAPSQGSSKLTAEWTTADTLVGWFKRMIVAGAGESAEEWVACGSRFSEATRGKAAENNELWKRCLLTACLEAGSSSVNNAFDIARDHIWDTILIPLTSGAVADYLRGRKRSATGALKKAKVLEFAAAELRALASSGTCPEGVTAEAWRLARSIYATG